MNKLHKSVVKSARNNKRKIHTIQTQPKINNIFKKVNIIKTPPQQHLLSSSYSKNNILCIIQPDYESVEYYIDYIKEYKFN